jgi:hypothetical protein
MGFSANQLEYGRCRCSLNLYKEEAEKMKRSILVLVCAATAQFFLAQNATAFPGERIPYRAAHFAHNVAYNINYHVVHPVRHGIARRLP